jgi:hypothetical protein
MLRHTARELGILAGTNRGGMGHADVVDWDRAGGRVKYPVEPAVDDRRFEMLARDVGVVLEQHGYPRVNGGDRANLEKKLIEFLYATPGLEAIEQRLNAGAARPLRTMKPASAVAAADCTAAAHEMRVLRPVQLVVVAAIGNDGALCIGSAADEGRVLSAITDRMFDALEGACMTEGRVVEDAVHVVPAAGAAS